MAKEKRKREKTEEQKNEEMLPTFSETQCNTCICIVLINY